MNARDELYAALAEGVKHAQLRQHHIDAHRAEVLREGLTDTERQFLSFALDLAGDQMASRGDEFNAEDEAALESLRRMAAEAVS